jgi:hypothetical protein
LERTVTHVTMEIDKVNHDAAASKRDLFCFEQNPPGLAIRLGRGFLTDPPPIDL